MLSLFLPSFLLLSEREGVSLLNYEEEEKSEVYGGYLSSSQLSSEKGASKRARMKERLESGEKYHRNGRDREAYQYRGALTGGQHKKR